MKHKLSKISLALLITVASSGSFASTMGWFSPNPTPSAEEQAKADAQRQQVTSTVTNGVAILNAFGKGQGINSSASGIMGGAQSMVSSLNTSGSGSLISGGGIGGGLTSSFGSFSSSTGIGSNVTSSFPSFSSGGTDSSSGAATQSALSLVKMASIGGAVSNGRNLDPNAQATEGNGAASGSSSGGWLSSVLGGNGTSGTAGSSGGGFLGGSMLGDIAKVGSLVGAAVGGKTGNIIGAVSSGAVTTGNILNGGVDNLTWRDAVNLGNVGLQTYAATQGNNSNAQTWARVGNLGTGLVNTGVVDKAIDWTQSQFGSGTQVAQNTQAANTFNSLGNYSFTNAANNLTYDPMTGNVMNTGDISLSNPTGGAYTTYGQGTYDFSQQQAAQQQQAAKSNALFSIGGIDVSSKQALQLVQGGIKAAGSNGDTTKLYTAVGNIGGSNYGINNLGSVTGAAFGSSNNSTISTGTRVLNTLNAGVNTYGQNTGTYINTGSGWGSSSSGWGSSTTPAFSSGGTFSSGSAYTRVVNKDTAQVAQPVPQSVTVVAPPPTE